MFAISCGGAPRIDYDYSKEPDPRLTEYVIGISDGLSINVWKNPELSTEAIVRPDGMITLPLIGDLRAVGRTPSEIRDELGRQLAKYLREQSPVVTVAVTAINSYSFTVSGNVENAGVFTAQKYVTVFDAIQLAGGPNRFASPERTTLLRKGQDGKVRTIPINYEELKDGKRLEANLALLPGDRVHVP